MYSSVQFAFAVGCPTLAFLSPVLGQRAGLPVFWQVLLFGIITVLGLAVLSEKNRPKCQGRTKRDLPCRHTVNAGEKLCFQHQQGLQAKLRAIPRSHTKTFWAGIGANAFGWALTIALFVAGLPPKPVLAIRPGPPTNVTATVQ